MFTNEKSVVIYPLGVTGQDDERFRGEVNHVLLDFC